MIRLSRGDRAKKGRGVRTTGSTGMFDSLKGDNYLTPKGNKSLTFSFYVDNGRLSVCLQSNIVFNNINLHSQNKTCCIITIVLTTLISNFTILITNYLNLSDANEKSLLFLFPFENFQTNVS